MDIKRIQHIDDPHYLRFIEENGTAFHQPKWLYQYGEALHLYGINQGEHIVGVFFVYVSKKWGITFYRNPPYTPHIGLITAVKANNASKILSEKKRIIKAVADFFEERSGGIVTASLPAAISDNQPFTWNGFKASVGYTYQFDLPLTTDQLDQAMSAEHRNLMKKALKDGVSCRLTQDYSLVRSLVQKTFERKNKDLDQSRLDYILNKACDEKNSFAIVAERNGTPIATAFCMHDRDTAYYLLGGYDPAEKHGGAGILNIAMAIDESNKRGLKTFDFEGSMLPEVERFFRGFGPRFVSYFGFHKAALPLEIALKFKKRNLF